MRKLTLASLALLCILLSTLVSAYILTRPWLDPDYGILTISLGSDHTVYLKRLDGGAIGPERFWISTNPKRCAGFPDLQHDVLLNGYDNTLYFRAVDGELYVYALSPPKLPPHLGTLRVHVIPVYDEHRHEMIRLNGDLQDDYRKLNLNRLQLTQLTPCKRFPDGLTDGGWHDWFD